MSNEAIIDVRQLSFRYGVQPILDDISLGVDTGEFLGLIGPNGGGKTTLLRILLGLEQKYEGHVQVFGEVPSRGHAWRRRVGVVPQLRPPLSRFAIRAWDVVEMGTLVRGAPAISASERAKRVEAALARVGAASFAHQPLRRLSGGQQQRVFLARALVSQPDLLLLDEPTVGVDAEGQDLLLEWIARWRRERNLTVVLVSHDIGVIAPLADRIACLNTRLFFHDRPDRLTGETLQQAYGCPAEVIFHSAHAVPHRVLRQHGEP